MKNLKKKIYQVEPIGVGKFAKFICIRKILGKNTWTSIHLETSPPIIGEVKAIIHHKLCKETIRKSYEKS